MAKVRNDAFLNEELDPLLLIQQLKVEIVQLKEEITFLKQEGGEEGGEEESNQFSESQQQKARTQCENFLQNPNPQTKLSFGSIFPSISYATFQLGFQYCREIYQQHMKDRASAPAAKDNDEIAIEDIIDDENASIEDLRQLLKQRNQEISILVKRLDRQEPQSSQHDKAPVKEAKKKSGPSWLSEIPQPERSDDDASEQGLFDHFRQYYPKNTSMAENKTILQQKYQLAKDTGKAVNFARSEINRLKGTIERERKERAVDSILHDEKDDEQTSASSEHELQDQIQQFKLKYKESFGELRHLKVEIEHLQRMLEKARSQMQQDFDLWRTYLQDKGKQGGHPKEAWTKPETEVKAKATGDPSIDNDIAAFYKANELFQRRNRK